MEELSKIKISDIYKIIKSIDANIGLNLFDEEIINEDIAFGDNILAENINKFNNHTDDLISAFAKNDIKSIKDHLIYLRVESMGLASDFDNLKDDIDKLIQAL